MPLVRFIWLIALCCGYASAAAPADEIQRILSTSPIRGTAVALIRETGEPEIIIHGDDGRTQVTASTRFRAGSVSKLVTSCLVLRMEQAGMLRITDRVNDLWPSLMEDGSTRVEHLLEHTAGIVGSSYEDYAMQAPGASASAYVLNKSPFPARWSPGLHYSYANDGHTIAAAILEKLSSTDFDTLIRREIFQPLGMENSGFLPDTSLSLSFQDDGKTEAARWDMAFRPSGGLITTADDLAKLVKMLLAEGRLPDGSEFLPSAAIRRMHRAETSLAAAHGLHAGAYGLGNFCFVAAGHPFRGHWGRTEGFQANLGYLPGNGRGFALLVNTDDRQGVSRLREAIASSLTRDLSPASLPLASGNAPPFPADGIYVNASHEMPLRSWLFELLDARRITATRDGLSVSGILPWSRRTQWIATGPNRYQAVDLPVATGTFARDEGKHYWIDGKSYLQRPALLVSIRLTVLFSGILAAVVGGLMLPLHLVSFLRRSRRLSLPLLFTGLSSLLFLWLVIAFIHYGLGGPSGAAALGQPGAVAVSLLVSSVLAPIIAIAAVGSTIPGSRWGTLFLSVPLLLLSILLAASGWFPLNTFS